LDLSEQQVVDCVPEIQPSNQGCAGGYLDSVCIYAVRFPIISERIYPYSAVQSVCNKDRVASATPGSYQIKNYNFISDCNTLASTLINLKPIGVCGMIDSKWQTYLGGVINNCTSAIIGGHCVLLVGAVSDGTSTVSTNYWIVKNSWGSNFGEYGFMRLFRDPNDLT
jgi:C1A family cysteine protease